MHSINIRLELTVLILSTQITLDHRFYWLCFICGPNTWFRLSKILTITRSIIISCRCLSRRLIDFRGTSVYRLTHYKSVFIKSRKYEVIGLPLKSTFFFSFWNRDRLILLGWFLITLQYPDPSTFLVAVLIRSWVI